MLHTAVLTIAAYLGFRLIALCVRILGWNINSAQSSKKLTAPEIIVQTANVSKSEELHDTSKLISDDSIPKNSLLAYELLQKPASLKNKKIVIGIPEHYLEALSEDTSTYLATRINDCLKFQNSGASVTLGIKRAKSLSP